MANFEIFKANDNNYRALVQSQNKIEFTTNSYDSRTRAIEAINRIRKNAQRHDSYKLVQLDCGSWLFELYDMSTNMLLGYSKSYVNKKVIERKIQEMRILAPLAKYISVPNSGQFMRL